MFTLPNDCFRSEIYVSPANWESARSKTNCTWTISYRFYDPAYKDSPNWGKIIKIRGVNHLSDRKDRQDSTRKLIQEIKILLTTEGYNPITKVFKPPPLTTAHDVSPRTTLPAALHFALTRLEVQPKTIKFIQQWLVHLDKAIRKLDLYQMCVSDTEPKHIIFILDKIGEMKRAEFSKQRRKDVEPWSASSYNHLRSYIMMLFKPLIPLGAIKFNPVRDVPKKKEVKRKRKIMLPEERAALVVLKDKRGLYPFWRFLHIFFHSGARISELTRLQMKDVSLKDQRFRSVVYKGRQYSEEDYTIKDIALPLWKELTAGAKPDDYVFGKGLVPGKEKISPWQITVRWRTHVKKGLGISANLYWLKHAHTTEAMQLLSSMFDAARTQVSAHNNHKGTGMVRNIYDVDNNRREASAIQLMNNAL